MNVKRQFFQEPAKLSPSFVLLPLLKFFKQNNQQVTDSIENVPTAPSFLTKLNMNRFWWQHMALPVQPHLAKKTARQSEKCVQQVH